MRHLIIGTVVLVLALSAGHQARTDAHASEPRGCIVFEDDSFMCGTLEEGGWLDRSHPYLVGCIPDGLCADRGYTDEDAARWDIEYGPDGWDID